MDHSNLWRETTEALTRFEEAETTAEQARSAYHELIRRLSTSGVSLREIALRLELSRQRVHQIVSGAACSFCDRRRADVARLAAGPGVFICDRYTVLGLHALAQGWGASDESTRMEVRADDELRCCFCRKRTQKVGSLATRGGMRICGHCLTLATRGFDRSMTPTLRVRPGRRRRQSGLDRITSQGRQALAQAESAARSMHHETITDEHLLLGLLGVEDRLAARILTNLGVTADTARRAVVAETPEGSLPVEGPSVARSAKGPVITNPETPRAWLVSLGWARRFRLYAAAHNHADLGHDDLTEGALNRQSRAGTATRENWFVGRPVSPTVASEGKTPGASRAAVR